MAMSGTEFGEHIRAMRGPQREKAVLDAVANEQYPTAFGTKWMKVVIQGNAGGKMRKLEIFVAPDFFAVGTDADPFYIGGWTTTAQQIAEAFDAILPSQKISDEIYKQAGVKLSLLAVNPGEPWYNTTNWTPRNIEDTGAFIAANKKRNAELSKHGGERWNQLVAGHMKDILTNSKGLVGSCPTKKCVTIFGGAGGSVDGWAIQGKSTVHNWDYGPDYSHGIRLVSKQAKLDGEDIELKKVFMDPQLSALVTNEGPYSPLLPSPQVSGGQWPPKGGSDVMEPGRPASNRNVMVLGALGLGLVLMAAFSGTNGAGEER